MNLMGEGRRLCYNVLSFVDELMVLVTRSHCCRLQSPCRFAYFSTVRCS